MERIIFHIDVNNAFLSWTAVNLLKKGYKQDIRKIPSIIGGDESKRHGIVLAKSPVAKKMGIVTAETIYSAKKKCKNLQMFEPDFKLYNEQSNLMYEYLTQYTPNIERFSVDECFLDMTGTNLIYKDYVELAYHIKDEIKEKYGFTVNVGIGNNKLCAKMASDFEKPDKVHTLFQNEIEQKLWPLPVGELFMVGKKTAAILNKYNIKIIKDLATANMSLLKDHFKNQAQFLKDSANGIDYSEVISKSTKCTSISTTETLPYDYKDINKLKEILFIQAEEVSRRLRKQQEYASTVAVIYKNNLFENYTRQTKMAKQTNQTIDIYNEAINILESTWKRDPIRLIGIRISGFSEKKEEQISLFDINMEETDKNEDFQNIIDSINDKFGKNSVVPASIKKINIDNNEKNKKNK